MAQPMDAQWDTAADSQQKEAAFEDKVSSCSPATLSCAMLGCPEHSGDFATRGCAMTAHQPSLWSHIVPGFLNVIVPQLSVRIVSCNQLGTLSC